MREDSNIYIVQIVIKFMGITKKLVYTILVASLLLVIGTIFFHYYEAWSYIDAFYFSTMTLTTIGYGDLAPTTGVTKIFTSIYSIFGIGVILYLVTSVIGTYMVKRTYVYSVVSKLERLGKRLRYPHKSKKTRK